MKKLITLKALIILVGLTIIRIHSVHAQSNYVAYSAADKSVSFSDNFDNNANQWITDNQWISAKVADGYYLITCKNKQSAGLSSLQLPIDAGQDYEIEADIMIIKGVGALLFGMNDLYDHYRIEISENNSVSVLRDTPSKKKKVEKLNSGLSNTTIRKDSYNKLTLRCVKGVFYVYANESLAGQFNNIKPEGSKIGFSVGTDSEISVDYLKISILKSPAPATTDKVAVNEIPKSAEAAVTSKILTSQSNFNAAPKVIWVSPSGQKTNLETFNANVRASIKTNSGLKSVLLYVNGVSKGEADARPVEGEEGSFIVEKAITFGPGENNIYLVATNTEGTTKSELRYFTNPSAVAPAVTWASPVNPNNIVSTESFTISACIKSPTELKSVRLLVNGNTQTEDNIFQPSASGDCNYLWQSSVVLKSGDNSIYIIATNIAGSTTSEKRQIKLETTMAEKRLALVFGNSTYSNNSVLKNPVNDANLMEGTLKELGFDVIKRLDAGKNEMMAAIREFNEKLPAYNIALFYYAGHGNQVDGKNYMIPVDALLEKPSDCRFEAIGVDFIVEEFERYPDNTNIVILDACRNNPYASWARGGEAGYRAMTFSSGTIIAFATSEGATAADGKGANGLFTEELVKQMSIPQSVFNVFMKTRMQVKKLSNGQQVPMEWNKLNGDFYFKK